MRATVSHTCEAKQRPHLTPSQALGLPGSLTLADSIHVAIINSGLFTVVYLAIYFLKLNINVVVPDEHINGRDRHVAVDCFPRLGDSIELSFIQRAPAVQLQLTA